MYYIYQSFFHLNKRFEKLLTNSILPISINILCMSKSNFQDYHSDMIVPNKHRIISLHLSDVFFIDMILSPPRILSKFLRLETLILDNIKVKHLENILNHALSLPNLYSLVIKPVDYCENSNNVYRQIFRLPVLKYCKISLSTSSVLEWLSIGDDEYSPIEHLVIDDTVYFDTLDHLLSYVPQLRKLSIQCLHGYLSTRTELSAIKLNHLTHLSLDFHSIFFDQFEKLIKEFFIHVQVLHISTGHNIEYLNDHRWEQLILFHMPYLRVFDFNHAGGARHAEDDGPLSYDGLISKFKSSFWLERQCFFTYKRDSSGNIGIEIFYSTDSSKYGLVYFIR
jgi:hypothetical protein